MKLIATKDAEGHVLCHDMTRIIPGKEKGAAFKKGHIVTKSDIEKLLSMGKENLYVWEKNENMLHEDEAAEILLELCINENMHRTDVSEGKIELIADCGGVLKVDTNRLNAINSLGEMMIATRRGNFPVKKGDKLAGMRVIPLVIEKEKMEKAKSICPSDTSILSLIPYKKGKASIITTGGEVASGRIEDAFGPVIREKLSEYDIEVMRQTILGDNPHLITEQIIKDIKDGADMVFCTGGMSVDPDDKTPLAIKNTGADIVTYGAPVLPGAMFLLSYLKDVPVMGLPGCVMYAKRTIFDIILPRILTGEKLTAADISCLGEGGLCLNCDVCTFPNCGFGK